MLDPSPQLRRALAVHAPHRNLAFVLHHLLPHSGHVVGMRNFFSVPVRKIGPNTHHRWNHFAGLFDEDNVADADIFPFDLLFVVQSRALKRDFRSR